MCLSPSWMYQLVFCMIFTFEMLTNVAKPFWLAFHQHFSLMPFLKFTANCNPLEYAIVTLAAPFYSTAQK